MRPNVFLGQGATSSGAKGQTQSVQNDIVKAFHMGRYNTLVSLSRQTERVQSDVEKAFHMCRNDT